MSKVAPSKEEFVTAVQEAFAYLVKEFGLRQEPIPSGDRNVWVGFSNDRTRVVVEGTNWGLNARVAIGRSGPPECFENYDLEDLLAERGSFPEPPPERGSVSKGSTQLRQVRHYAKALRAIGPDILRGDFSVFSELQKRVSRRRRHLGASN